MKCIEVMSSPSYICGGWIYELDKHKKTIAGIEPKIAKERKGACKSNSVCVRLYSDAPMINIKCTIADKFVAELVHTGICAQYGLACSYRICGEEIWHNADCYSGREDTFDVLVELEDIIPAGKQYELIIYGPIYAYLSDMIIMVEDEYSVEPIEKDMKKILFIGGPATYGAGVTSASMMFSNIFARRYDIIPMNLSYYWWNWMNNLDEILGKLKEKLEDVDMIFLECDTPRSSYDVLDGNLQKIVDYLIKNTHAKLVLWNYPVASNAHGHEERQELIREIVENYKDVKDRLVFCDNYLKWEEEDFDMYTYDGSFINDTGNIWIYRVLEQYVEELCQNI